MKEELKSLPHSKVLNPHGSDETNSIEDLGYYIVELLNPHGSDETKMVSFQE